MSTPLIRPSWAVYKSLCQSPVKCGGSNPPPEGALGKDGKPKTFTDPVKVAFYDNAYQWGIGFNNLVELPGDPGAVMDAWIAASTPDPVTGVVPPVPLLTQRW